MIQRPADIQTAADEGRQWYGILRRAGPAVAANGWADLSYAAGNPVANYYIGGELTATALTGRVGVGIDHGPDAPSGMKKYIRRMCVIPPSTSIGIGQFYLHDIVMFYPFIDGDAGYQELINDISIPRYGGVGCKIMAVSLGAGTALSNYRITYTNSDGVSGRVIDTTFNLLAAAGQIASHVPAGTASTYKCGPYVELLPGDKGVQSIQSVEPLTAAGGIHVIAIVKPLGDVGMVEATTSPCEVDFAADRGGDLPDFENGAYLGMLLHATTGATPATVLAEVETIWN